jgi:hypoxanthine phosphoribosyltransferase
MTDALDAARASGLLAGPEPVLVLLSGGRDSCCLLDVAVALCGAARVRALHVNYGLREEAGADERACRELAARLGVALEVVRADPAVRGPGNLQAWARELRYAEAERRAAASGGLIAVGHTASDQVETVLYRLASSPGRRALLGMPARDGRRVRPLLAVDRERTAAHCRARGIAWREDASNEDRRFARARVRADLLPALRALHPAAEANVQRTARLLREEAAVLDAAVDSVLAGAASVDLGRLRELPAALARLVVLRLAEDAAGGPAPEPAGRLEELLALACTGGTVVRDLGGGVRAVVEYGRLRFEPLARAPGGEPPPQPVSLAVPGEVAFGSWTLRAGAGAGAGALLDAARAGSRLSVRAWRPGDRLRPAGRGGSRSVADLFGERRVPRARRAGWPVVEVDGEIACVPDLAVAEPFAAGEGRGSVVWVQAVTTAGHPAPPMYTGPPEMPVSLSDPAIGETLVPAEALQRRVGELAREISRDYAGRSLLLIGVLKGAVFFLSDLMRSIDIPVEVDFMAVASYGSATDSSGVVRILKDLDVAIEGRDVLIVEDIVDSGLTLQYLMRNLGSRNPASLEVCALLTKPSRRKVELQARYVGFEIPDEFAIGYGLDHAERFRNLPFVAALRGDR